MKNDYLVYKTGVDAEDLYLYNGTLVDIVKNKILLNITQLIVQDYWRRNDRYMISAYKQLISINPKLEVFSSMKDDEERFKYVEQNWRNIVRLALSKVYPNDFELLQISINDTNISYEKFENETEHGDKTVSDYFMENYPDLNYVHITNGYKPEFIGYFKVNK